MVGWLERPFSPAEILDTLMSYNNKKVHGPDGFTMCFLQKSLEVIKDEIFFFLFFVDSL